MSDDPVEETNEELPAELSFRALVRRYGKIIAEEEARRTFLRALANEILAAKAAVAADGTNAYQAMSREALAGLALLAASRTEDDLAELLDSFEGLNASQSQFKELWSGLGNSHDIVVGQIEKVLGSLRWDSSLSADALRNLSDSLEKRSSVLRDQLAMSVKLYGPILTDLQASFLAGNDVVSRLEKLNRDDHIQSFLERLADIYISSEKVDLRSEEENYPLYVARRYAPLLGIWRELRFKKRGRVNHWARISHNHYLDVDTGYPQVEFHVYSHNSELLYMRDDVDDVFALATAMMEMCAESVKKLTSRGGKVTTDMSARIKHTLHIADDHVKQTLQLLAIDSNGES